MRQANALTGGSGPTALRERKAEQRAGAQQHAAEQREHGRLADRIAGGRERGAARCRGRDSAGGGGTAAVAGSQPAARPRRRAEPWRGRDPQQQAAVGLTQQARAQGGRQRRRRRRPAEPRGLIAGRSGQARHVLVECRLARTRVRGRNRGEAERRQREHEHERTEPFGRAPIVRRVQARTSPAASDRANAIGVAAALLGLAVAGGGYGAQARAIAAVLVWWIVLLGLAAGLLPLRAPARPARWLCGLLAALALLSGLSAAWASDAGAAVQSTALVALYAGVALLALLLLSEHAAGAWLRGIALGLVALAALALASRALPGLLHDPVGAALPSARARLGFPLGYWNALGLAMAAALVLLAWHALAGATRAGRSAALAATPLAALVLYLTSSRGAVAALLLGIALLIGFERRRLALALQLVPAAGASLALAALASSRTAVVDGLDGTLARSEARGAVALTLLACAALGALRWLADGPLQRALAWRADRRLALAALGLGVLVALALLVAADPHARWEDFRRPPTAPAAAAGGSLVADHLLSGGGSGRYQFWTEAWHAFARHPIDGLGAGGYEAWWTRHGTLPAFVRNAHSLPLETLAELGLLGGALLLALAGITGGAALVRRRAPASPAPLAPAIALAGCGALGATIDWMWQVPAVLLPALVGAVIATGLPTAAAPARRRAAWALPAAATAVLALALSALVLVGDAELRRSRDAARAGELGTAARAAADATALQPWATAPRLQLALVEELRGDLPAALRAAAAARERAPLDWRALLVLARLRAKAGDATGAQRALDELRCVAPRSIFPPVDTLASRSSIDVRMECSDGGEQRDGGA
jgi:O-antigen ligase